MAPSFGRNTLLGFGSGAAVALAGFVGNTIAARLLGPDGFGVYGYVVWCVTVASVVAAMGLDVVQQRFIPNLRGEGRDDEVAGLVGAASWLSVVGALVAGVALVAYIAGPARSALEILSPTTQTAVIIVALIWFVCWRMSDLDLFNLKGEQRFGDFARVSAVSAVMKVSTMALGALLFGVPGALAGYVAGTIWPAVRSLRLLRNRPRIGPELRRELVGFTLVSWGIAIVGSLVFGRTPVFFLEHYTGLEAVGLFVAAVTVAEMALQLPPLLLSALLPRFSEQRGRGAADDMQRLYQTMTAFIAMVILPLCLCLAAIAPVLVPLVFGEAYADAVFAASVLVGAAAISGLGGTTLHLILSVGKTGILLISNTVGLVGTIGLSFALVPQFGLMGAVWARAIVQVVVILIEMFCATRQIGIVPPFRALGATALAAAAQGGVAYGVVASLGGAISLAVAIPAALITYLAALRWLAVFPRLEPELAGRLVGYAPPRVRPTVARLLNLLSPDTKGHRE